MRAADAARRLGAIRPLYVLAPLIVAEWLVTAGLAAAATHNGWLYFNGGDATEYWAHEWAVAHGFVPRALLGYAIPLAFGWVPPLFGETLVAGLPAIVLCQVVLLVPLAVVLMYALGSRIAGRLFGYFVAAAWVAVPIAAVPLFRSDYHERYVDQFLPQAFGLVNLGDFASLVVVSAAAYFVLRAIDEGRAEDALLAGLLVGLAVGVKPSNGVFVPIPVVVLLVARQPWNTLRYAVALVPALVTLTIWKQKGYGTIPLLTAPVLHEAAGTSIPGLEKLRGYGGFSWSQLEYNRAQIREFFWSRLLLEWLIVAGAFASIRRSGAAKGLLLVLWLLAFYVIKGGSAQADVRTASFWRLTMAGFPAFLLLACSVVLLVPGLTRHVRVQTRAATRFRPRTVVAVVAVVAALVPLVAVAALPSASSARIARDNRTANESPISGALHVRATPAADGVALRWDRPQTHGSSVFYLAFRQPATLGDGCTGFAQGAKACLFDMPLLGRTGITKLVDSPTPGRYTYRIAMAAAPVPNDADRGDTMLLSPPVTVEIRCTTAKCKRDVKAQRADAATP